MLALCFSKGTFGCKKQKFTETGLSVKANWLERNEAISQNPRAGSGAGDFKGSEPGTKRICRTKAGDDFCVPLFLSETVVSFSSCSTSQLSLFPTPRSLLLQAHKWDGKSEAQSAHPSPWSAALSMESPSLSNRGQKTNSNATNRPASRGGGRDHQASRHPKCPLRSSCTRKFLSKCKQCSSFLVP